MGIKSLSILIILTIMQYSCEVDPFVSNNEGRMDLNGIPFYGQVLVGTEHSPPNKFTFKFVKFKKLDKNIYVISESITIGFIKRTLQKQTIYKGDSLINLPLEFRKTYARFHTMVDDGDVLGDTYTVVEDDSLNNYFLITGELRNFQEIWGQFSITLRRDYGNHSSYGDTIKIRNGTFHIFFDDM